ncbi:MAG: aspartate--tRNA ligase [Deltaproteobacteria bacterium]|nr:aspartate--tRNA ligase [Deltaproteobacteria bacterium]
MDSLDDWRRTHNCGELRRKDAGAQVVLMGWVQRRRDHGGLIFVDLRDRYGVVQVVFNPDINPQTHTKAHSVRSEYVIAVQGKVALRPQGTANPRLATGEIEVVTHGLKILNESKTPPFPIEDEAEVAENVRLRYRYLDLRRQRLQENLILRQRAAKVVRDYLSSQGFLEIETPFLTRSTPEGARDYLVPSRLNPGSFYALPQSPQLFKQLLMISGFDRYFQIVKCFRDEDLRADRQPEFTQIDVEVSFVDAEDVQECIEGMLEVLFREILGVELKRPFPRMSYQEAISRYGLDRPDIRFGMELVEITDVASRSNFQVFTQAIEGGGIVKGINLKGGGERSRKEIDELVEVTKVYGAGGLAWVKVEPEGWVSPIVKFFQPEDIQEMNARMGGGPGDLLLFVADRAKVVNEALGHLRLHLARERGLMEEGTYQFVWIVDFPLLEYDEGEGRYTAVHHPFTAPKDEDVAQLKDAPLEVRAKAYDIVLNGAEIGGGSIRNHRGDIQRLIFEILGIGPKEAEAKFGFLLEALDYGSPPHGGIALGFDRLVMLLCGAETIREVIPFPKTQRATCLLTDAPANIDPQQLKELHLKVEI